MCEYWGVDRTCYDRRIKNGWSKEKALATPEGKFKNSQSLMDKKIDPFGKEFKSVNDLCEYWNIKYYIYNSRLRSGYNKIQALGISIKPKPFSINIKQKKYDLYIDKRIYKDKDIFECYIGESNKSTFKIMNQEMIDQYCLECYKKEHNIAA